MIAGSRLTGVDSCEGSIYRNGAGGFVRAVETFGIW